MVLESIGAFTFHRQAHWSCRSGLGVDAVDFKALRFVQEEGGINASGEPAVKVGGVVGAYDEDMLGGGDCVGLVVVHRLVAVVCQAVIHSALDGAGLDQL